MKKTHLLTLVLVLELVAALLAVPTAATTGRPAGSTVPIRAAPAEARPAGERLPLPVQYALAVGPEVVNEWVQAAKLTASDGVAYDGLGWSVAMSADGNTVVAGASGSDAGGSDRGAVYVYTRPEPGWASTAVFTAKLTASDGADDDWLGSAVAVSADGSTVVASAAGSDAGGSDRGAVYVYVRPETGWASTAAFTARLTASDGADNDQLGYSVAVSGDGSTVVASTPAQAAGGTYRGAAYVYARPEPGWANDTQTAKLTASDGVDGSRLGCSVAVSADGSTVVAGAPFNAAGGTWRGAAYVYARPEPGWADATQTAKLTASDGADVDGLGFSVAVSADGGTAVAGATGSDAGGDDRGAAYVYARPEPGWADATETAKLTASDGADKDYLGCGGAVSADGGTVVAGAAGSDAGGSDRGALYVYARPEPGWASTAAFAVRLTASDGADGDVLGCAVAVSADGSTVIGGVANHDAGGTGRGAAYVWVSSTPITPAVYLPLVLRNFP